MSRLELWFMRRILRAEVRQGYDHGDRIAGLYRLVSEACREEFTEDNEATLSAFLRGCFIRAQRPLK